ncbi:MAG: hypothetical protein R3239_02700, partial [Thermodesulfobacteriota bacterium]|nr:hypothetical protein [Thermodesulfobacteriota bacterium]
MRRLLCLGVAAILAIALSACGGGGNRNAISGPGFVGIDDSTADTAPLLTVTYYDPLSPLILLTAKILSDPLSDGDIAFDPVSSIFTVATEVTPLFFGVDSSDSNLPEYKAFLTFPLDGVTGQDVLPLGAVIDSATVELFITQVSYADTVPTFLDLIQYEFRNLGQNPALDFNAPPIDFRTLDFYSTDPGNFVLIDITPLVQTAQDLALLDFQIRLSLAGGVPVAGVQGARPQAASKKAERT